MDMARLASLTESTSTGSSGIGIWIGFLETIHQKGANTYSEAALKVVKEVHRKMVTYCKPLPSGVFESLSENSSHYIIISEEPKTIGCPPGLRQADLFHKLEVELWAIHDRVIGADRSANPRAAGAHAKLIQLLVKLTIILDCQRQQVKLDRGFEAVRAAFKEIVDVETLEGTSNELWSLNKIAEVMKQHKLATEEGTSLAGRSPGNAVVLAPVESWRRAVEAAKRDGYLKPDFPDLEVYPLNKIAAIEIKQVTVMKRQGVRRAPVLEGRTRLLTSPEYQEIKKNLAGEATEHISGEMLILPTYATEEDIIQASWVDFPDSLRSSSALWQAELLEVEPMKMALLLSSLEDLASRWRYFAVNLYRFLQLRKKYSGRPLNVHAGYKEVMAFPTAFSQCLSENLLDQIPREGSTAGQTRQLLEALAKVVESEEEFLEQSALEEDDDDDNVDDYYEETHEYFELLADEQRPPPVNPDYVRPSAPSAGAEQLQGRSAAPEPEEAVRPPSLPPTDVPLPRERVLPERFEGRRSRSSSGSDSVQSGGAAQGDRVSAPATTASQLRGDGRTHTIALQLQRNRTILMTLEASPDSTRYKSQREKVAKMLAEAERHLREDDDVSLSYEDVLDAEMQATEEAMATKDDQFDLAMKEKKKIEDEKKNLLATLPRGLGQKFSGLAQDWPTFRDHFERITKTVDSSLAVAHMIQLVEDPKLKKQMKIYTSGEEILKVLDRQFGHRFLNCQGIINRVNKSKAAANKRDEMDLIVQYRQAKAALERNKDNENLLNVDQLISWAEKLLPSTSEELQKIVQDSDFGSLNSPLEPFFAQLERVYERNSVLIRHRESREPAKGRFEPGKKGKQVGYETDLRNFGSEGGEGGGCKAFCTTGQPHRPHNCPLLANGKIGLKKVKKAKLCSCCVAPPDSCKKGILKRKDGSSFSIACSQCGHSKKIACHNNCKKKEGQPQPSPSISGPPVEISGSTPEAASLTELRCEMTISCLANSNPLGSASEMIDECVLLAPDGTRKLIRVLYDWGATDSVISYTLARFFHHWAPARVAVNGANSSRNYKSHVGEIRLLKADDTWLPLKAIKGDLSGRAFTLKPKTVDIPFPLHHHFEGTYQSYNDMGDLRVGNLSEESRVELIIGLDSCALAPFEVARWHDSHGQMLLHRSAISNKLIVTGSRRTGAATVDSTGTDQRTYSVLEEDNRTVSLLRATVDLQDTRSLFLKRTNLTKIEKKLFSHIEDCDEIVPPLSSLCHQCEGCQVCRDPFKAKREETIIKILDQLVTFKEGEHKEGGGFHIRLLYDPTILAQVPEGKKAALRRLLATERQLMKPGMELARENFNKKVQDCRDKGYLVRPEQLPEITGMQKAYMPFSFALKDEENSAQVAQVAGYKKSTKTFVAEDKSDCLQTATVSATAPPHKTKARPVVDCSAVAEPGKASVNQAQFKIPDPHTSKITELLLRLRTAKRFCLGDISEYFFRLWCDPLTSSLTRVLFRDGGLGGDGDIVELVSVVSSMGMKQVPTFAAHVRYRLSLLIEDKDPEAARQLRESYADDIHLAERFGSCRLDGDQEHVCEDGEVLVERAVLVEKVLNDAHLFLGEKWMTDVNQEKCPPTMTGVTEGGTQVELTLGNSGQTSALGYRLHLGQPQPDGGALLWRVHRPQSLNLEPKSRGARPDWAQLASSRDIRMYLKEHGVTKANLLSLCANLYDPLLLAAPFISSARLLFRQVLREVSLPTWKSMVPERYHERIALLAEDLLEVAKKMKVPRRAVVPNPIQKEQHSQPIGFATLLIVSDGSCEAGVAAAYIHQQFPFESGSRPPTADFSDVTVSCNLLCAALKLTDNQGHNGQVDGELLGKFLSCQLREFVVNHALIDFHQVRHCGDSLTVERAIRKSDAAYNIWAGKRIAYIQQSMDLDESWHVPHEITDGTIDSCTKQQKRPSVFLNDGWFHGTGVLDKPLQLIQYTDRTTYSHPRLDDLPAQWLSTAARSFIGLKLPTVIVMRVELDEEPPEMTLLEQLANKYRDVDKAISVLQCLLKMQPKFRELSVPAQREACRVKFISSDYEKISQQLGKRSRRMTQQLLLEDDKERRVFTLKGRFGYRATLLASPKTSQFAKLVLQSAHDKHHVTNSSRIMAKVGRHYAFTGGALSYLDQLREKCHMCRLLKPEAVKLLLGNTPPFMRGMLPDATTTWRHQSTDIFGPWMMAAFPGSRGTRAGQKRIKAYGLLVFDYSTRAIDATLIEDYSASSVILGLKTIWSRVGRPQWLGFDAASNIASAEEIVAGDPDLQMPSLVEAERLQQALRERLGGMIELRPRVPYAPFRQVAEMGVQFCKREIRKMLQQSAGGLLTPLQASAILSEAVAHINERPLVIHVAPDDRGVLTPWFLSARNMSTFHSQNVELNEDLDHPLSRRAFQAQQRLDLFKGMFNVYYFKEMVKFGHWNTKGKQPGVGDVVLVLDKTKPKAHFLQKFQLGRIRRFISEHVCEIDFVKQDQKVTSALIRALRSRSQDWRENYKVKISTCTRDLRSITIVCAHSQEGELRKGFEIDLMVDQQPGLMVDQQREEDLVVDPQGEEDPAAEGGINAADLLQPATTPDEASGAVSEKTTLPVGGQVDQDTPGGGSQTRKRRKPLKEKWLFKQ